MFTAKQSNKLVLLHVPNVNDISMSYEQRVLDLLVSTVQEDALTGSMVLDV